MPTREEIAEQVAKKFKLVKESGSWYFDCPVFDKHERENALIESLIDAEVRLAERERVISGLDAALCKSNKGWQEDGIKLDALIEFKKSVDNAVTVAFLSMTDDFGATDPREAIEHIRREFRDAERKFQQQKRSATRAESERVKELREALRGIISDMEHLAVDRSRSTEMSLSCRLCGGYSHFEQPSNVVLVHGKDCQLLRARAVLSEESKTYEK